jgi:hypothetical protein
MGNCMNPKNSGSVERKPGGLRSNEKQGAKELKLNY